jgi:hypothetical protein
LFKGAFFIFVPLIDLKSIGMFEKKIWGYNTAVWKSALTQSDDVNTKVSLERFVFCETFFLFLPLLFLKL